MEPSRHCGLPASGHPQPPCEKRRLGGAHSDDEHISVRSLMKMIEYLWNTVLEVAAN